MLMCRGLANLAEFIPRGGWKPALRQLPSNKSARFRKLSDEIFISHRHLLPPPHGDNRSPSQYPKVAARTVKRYVEVGQCSCSWQPAALKQGVADEFEAIGGGRVEHSQVLFSRLGTIQHRTGSVFIIRREGIGRGVERFSHSRNHFGGSLSWPAERPTGCHSCHQQCQHTSDHSVDPAVEAVSKIGCQH